MGNTKTLYIEGTLLPNVSRADFEERASNAFHFTYIATYVSPEPGGYLNVDKDEPGHFLVAAIHTYSTRFFLEEVSPLFQSFWAHWVDRDWATVQVARFDNKDGWNHWKADDDTWTEQPDRPWEKTAQTEQEMMRSLIVRGVSGWNDDDIATAKTLIQQWKAAT